MEDNELRAFFARVDGQFAEVNNRITTEIRHVGVEIEGLRAAMQLNNEMIYAVDEKLEGFRGETLDELKDIRTDIRVSFTMLGKRITDLENAR